MARDKELETTAGKFDKRFDVIHVLHSQSLHSNLAYYQHCLVKVHGINMFSVLCGNIMTPLKR